MSRDHQLFRQYPLNGSPVISVGKVPTPYHIYDGHGVLIGGTVDLTLTRRLLGNESVVPVETCDGRSMMGIWVCNFTDASLGPHQEVQFSFFFSQSRRPVPSHPLSLVALMTGSDVQMMCHGLWNDSPVVVAYNRELLSLDARLANSQIDTEANLFTFKLQDKASGEAIVSGRLANLQRVSLRANWDLMTQLGLRRVWTVARQPWLGLRILNPTGVGLTRNAVAETFTKNDTNLVRYFDDGTDHLEFGDTPYRALNFKPQFVQYMTGFKFVYLQPK